MDALTAEHRSKQLLLRRDTVTKVKRLTPLLRWDDLDGSYGRLERAVRPVVAANLQTSAGLSSAYLRALRAKRGVPGRVTPVRVSLDGDQFATSLRVTSVVAAKDAAARGVAAEVALRNASTLTANAMVRLVLNGGRDTVLGTLRQDRARYARVLGGEGCDFCQVLAGRGAVYSAETADFEAHDKCACTPEPDWG